VGAGRSRSSGGGIVRRAPTAPSDAESRFGGSPFRLEGGRGGSGGGLIRAESVSEGFSQGANRRPTLGPSFGVSRHPGDGSTRVSAFTRGGRPLDRDTDPGFAR